MCVSMCVCVECASSVCVCVCVCAQVMMESAEMGTGCGAIRCFLCRSGLGSFGAD